MIKTNDKILSKFWFALKTVNGNHYSVSSLKNICYGLNQVLAKKNTNMGIICDPLFKQSQKDFNIACACLKQLRFGYVKHYKEIKAKG